MTISSNSFLELRGVGVAFPGVKALDKVDMTLTQGKVMALIGENGAGKSTLVSVLAGLQPNFEGEVRLFGTKISLNSPRAASDLGISLVQQELSLVPDMSVAENIFLGHNDLSAVRGLFDKKLIAARAKNALKIFDVHIPVDARVNEISPAQAQLVEIAKGIARKPLLLILDEPTTALPVNEAQQLLKVIRKLTAAGTTVLYISHKLSEILEIAEHVTVLRDGQKVKDAQIENWNEESLIRAMVGRDLNKFFSRTPCQTQGEILQVQNLAYKDSPPVSFWLKKGEILGISGLIGAGRTEFVEMIAGIRTPVSGNIVIDGKNVKINSPKTAMNHGIGLVPEDRTKNGFIPEMTTRENISLATLQKLSRGQVVNRSKEKKQVSAIAASVNLQKRALTVLIRTLSGGNKQKAVLAKYLLANPRILILDEPTKGIDVGAKAEIYGILDRLAHAGMAIILVSSEMTEILGMSDRILVMYKGNLVAEFDRSNATEESIMTASSNGLGKGTMRGKK